MTLPVTVRSTTFHAPDVYADIAPSGVDSNLLAADISDVLKYFEFVLIRISSIRADAPTYHALMTAYLSDFTNLENRQVRLDLHRSIESDAEGLILFAVMALDRAARFTEQFFGPASKEWSTFNSFKYLEGYAVAHGLTSPEPELLEDIKWLEEHVVSFRHFYLAHRQEGSDRPRYSIGVSVHTKTGAISYGVQSVSYPTNNENPYTNMPIEEVVTVLERFVHEWLAYIDANVVSANSIEN